MRFGRARSSDPAPARAYRDPVDLDVGVGVVRERDRVVMRRDGHLPDRCIRCNAPARGRTYRQHMEQVREDLDPTSLLSIWFGVVTIRRNTSYVSIDVGLCARHDAARRLWSILAAPVFVLAACAFLVSVSIERGGIYVIGLSVLLWVIGASMVYRSRRPARVAAFDEERVVLAGLSRDYVSALPTTEQSAPVDAP